MVVARADIPAWLRRTGFGISAPPIADGFSGLPVVDPAGWLQGPLRNSDLQGNGRWPENGPEIRNGTHTLHAVVHARDGRSMEVYGSAEVQINR